MQILIIQNHKAIQALSGALNEVLCCYRQKEQRWPYFLTDTLPPFCLDPEFVPFSLHRILLATTEFHNSNHNDITAKTQESLKR